MRLNWDKSKRVLCPLFFCFLFHAAGIAEEGYEIGELVVTASRMPVEAKKLSRNVTIIEAEDIEEAPVSSLPELLEYAAGVDVRRRGVEGVQSDLSIRGSTFEQVLVLVDGIKMSDPQTGHHNMDIPLTLTDIERIEILHGQGSSIYGPNAFGGVVNIITKKPYEKKIEGMIIRGENSLLEGNISFSTPVKNSSHTFSSELKSSDGYIHNTDFDISTLYYRSIIETGITPLDILIGHTDKEFGADSFYSQAYPDQWEETKTTLANLSSQFENDNLIFEPRVYYREHRDKFLLDRNDPDFFTNEHTTYVYGSELDLNVESEWGRFVTGGEIREETIRSSNLGDHSRGEQSVFLGFLPDTGDKIFLNAELRGDNYEDWGWETSPGIGLAYNINPSVKLRSSLGRSFRIPSYTELYYESPVNKGNPDLEPEESWSLETGMDYYPVRGYSFSLSLFRREGKNLIDWVRESEEEPWEATNIREVDTDGIEMLFKVKPKEFLRQTPLNLITLGYSLLDSDSEDPEFDSKYVFDYLRHQLSLGLNHFLPFKIQQTLKLSYEDRVNGDSYLLLDIRLSRKFGEKGFEIFLDGTNLLDEEYEEIGGVPMPGMWIKSGVKFSF